jgi:hypothetical protein
MSAFVPIGHTITIPAVNTEPTMAGGAVVTLTDAGNVLELEGETDGSGTNKVYVLRKRTLDDGTFRYVPFAPDKPIVGELTGAGIYRFWDRLILGEVAPGEKVCLYNPAGGPVLSNCNVRLVRA